MKVKNKDHKNQDFVKMSRKFWEWQCCSEISEYDIQARMA